MRAVKMALFHDIGEAIIGDITKHDNVSRGVRLFSALLPKINIIP
jgi:5'-deoxynucleotidase YfbR-like HD superfamily hydrolase